MEMKNNHNSVYFVVGAIEITDLMKEVGNFTTELRKGNVININSEDEINLDDINKNLEKAKGNYERIKNVLSHENIFCWKTNDWFYISFAYDAEARELTYGFNYHTTMNPGWKKSVASYMRDMVDYLNKSYVGRCGRVESGQLVDVEKMTVEKTPRKGQNVIWGEAVYEEFKELLECYGGVVIVK